MRPEERLAALLCRKHGYHDGDRTPCHLCWVEAAVLIAAGVSVPTESGAPDLATSFQMPVALIREDVDRFLAEMASRGYAVVPVSVMSDSYVCPACGGRWWTVGDDSYACNHSAGVSVPTESGAPDPRAERATALLDAVEEAIGSESLPGNIHHRLEAAYNAVVAEANR